MSQLQTNYIHILDDLKTKIRESRVKAAVSVNVVLLKLDSFR